jgi:O-antigen ligase
LLVVLIALGALGYTMIPVSVIERVQMTEDEEGELDGSSEGRLELWEFGLKLWQESPIWGTGAGVYNVKAREMDRRERTRDPHNMYIKVLVQWGLVGLFFFLWIYLRGLRLSWRLYRRSGDEWMKGLGLGFLLCIVANMVMNFFHDAYSYVNVMGFYWVWLGLIVSALRIQQEEAAKSEEEVAVRLFFEGVGNGRKLS